MIQHVLFNTFLTLFSSSVGLLVQSLIKHRFQKVAAAPVQKQIRRFEVSVNNLDCEIAFESCILALLAPKGKKVKSIALYFCELHSTAIVLSNIKFSSILHFVWIHLKILESTLGATSNETFSVLMPDILLQGLCSAAFLDRFSWDSYDRRRMIMQKKKITTALSPQLSHLTTCICTTCPGEKKEATFNWYNIANIAIRYRCDIIGKEHDQNEDQNEDCKSAWNILKPKTVLIALPLPR